MSEKIIKTGKQFALKCPNSEYFQVMKNENGGEIMLRTLNKIVPLMTAALFVIFSCAPPDESIKSSKIVYQTSFDDTTADYTAVNEVGYGADGADYTNQLPDYSLFDLTGNLLITYDPPLVKGGPDNPEINKVVRFGDALKFHAANGNWGGQLAPYFNYGARYVNSAEEIARYVSGLSGPIIINNDNFYRTIDDCFYNMYYYYNRQIRIITPGHGGHPPVTEPVWPHAFKDIVDDNLKYFLLNNPYTDTGVRITPKRIQSGWSCARNYYPWNTSYMYNISAVLAECYTDEYLAETVAPDYNLIHDLGLISPVVGNKLAEETFNTAGELTSAKYILYYTRMYKEFTTENFYREYTYKYEPVSAVLEFDGSAWTITNTDAIYLKGIPPALNDRMVIVDVKKKDFITTMWYLSKVPSAGDDMSLESDGWMLYSAYSFNVEENGWTVNLGANTCLNLQPSGFDSNAISNAGVVLDGDSFKMWYSGKNTYNTEIGTAFSSVGYKEWSKDSAQAKLRTRSRLFDSQRVSDPTIMIEDTTQGTLYRIWYAGQNKDGLWKLGLAYNFKAYESEYSYFHSTDPLPIGDAGNDVRFPHVVPLGNEGNFLLLYSEAMSRTFAPDHNTDFPETSDKKLWTIKMITGKVNK